MFHPNEFIIKTTLKTACAVHVYNSTQDEFGPIKCIRTHQLTPDLAGTSCNLQYQKVIFKTIFLCFAIETKKNFCTLTKIKP